MFKSILKGKLFKKKEEFQLLKEDYKNIKENHSLDDVDTINKELFVNLSPDKNNFEGKHIREIKIIGDQISFVFNNNTKNHIELNSYNRGIVKLIFEKYKNNF